MTSLRPAFHVATALLLAPALGHAATTPSFEPPLTVAADAASHGDQNVWWRSAVESDGTGTWIVAWDGSDGAFGTHGNDLDIFFARSTDHGVSFSNHQPLNPLAASDTYGGYGANDEDPDLAADGAGNWVAVWYQNTRIHAAHSSDDGQSWTGVNGNLSVMQGETSSIATDRNGVWIAAVSDSNGFRSDDAWFSRSTDNGATWSARQLLDPTSEDRVEDIWGLRIFHAGAVWIAAWTVRDPLENEQLVYTRSLDGGLSWSPVAQLRPVGDGDPSGFKPDLAGDGLGNWIAVWSSASGADTEIRASVSSDNGATWSLSQAMAKGSGQSDFNPRISAGPAATFLAVWESRGGYGADSDIVGAITDDVGQTWSAPAPVNTTAASDSAVMYHEDYDVAPAIGWDSTGHWISVWSSNNTLNGTTGRFRRFLPQMAMTGLDCGNGVVDAGEQCDDGPRRDGDCCNRTCNYDAATVACTSDTDLCTADQCDGAGTCEHLNAPRLDCLDAPASDSSLRIYGSGEMRWSWKGTDPAAFERFGNPYCGTTDDYALCVYDDVSGLLTRADIPALESCYIDAPDQRWQRSAGTYRFKDPAMLDGVSSARLHTKAPARTSLSVTAEGPSFSAPALPLADSPVHVQLVNGRNFCWSATYSDSARNNARAFSAKSD